MARKQRRRNRVSRLRTRGASQCQIKADHSRDETAALVWTNVSQLKSRDREGDKRNQDAPAIRRCTATRYAVARDPAWLNQPGKWYQ